MPVDGRARNSGPIGDGGHRRVGGPDGTMQVLGGVDDPVSGAAFVLRTLGLAVGPLRRWKRMFAQGIDTSPFGVDYLEIHQCTAKMVGRVCAMSRVEAPALT